jgi:anaerobic ribonucleoside-triphosphate reductase
MLKKMEDAARGQLETLEQQSRDIHRLAEALEGGTTELIRKRVEQAITEYLTSDDSVRRMIAEEISRKILIGIREAVEERANANKS